jgi:ethanolamine permease
MEFSRWALNMAADGSELPYGNGPWLPFGFESALTALPSAVWLFLAIELVPLAAEEAKDPQRDVPWAIILAMLTLLVSALLTLWLTPSVIGVGTHRLASSGEPLLDGLRAIYGETHGKTAAGIAIVGLIASFHSLLFAQGRQIYALSRAGYFPPGLSVTHALSKTPVAAMVAGAAVGLGLIAMIHWTKGEEEGAAVIGGTLLNMAVAAAMFSIVAQALSFILLRARRPDMERPYVSPFGIPGALVIIAIAVVTLIYQLSDPAYRDGVVGLLIWLGLGTVYFALVGRHRLRLAPEEEFALAQNV